MACGGFLLAEYSTELEELFQSGHELEIYHTLDELNLKTQYYSDHLEEASAIALRSMQVVREKHTIRNQVEHMLRAVETRQMYVLSFG